MPLSQGSMLRVLLLACLLARAAQASESSCCLGQDVHWIQDTKNCTDGSRIQLTCPLGFYMIQPSLEPEEKFSVLESTETNVSWLSFENELGQPTFNASPDNYCMAKMAGEKEEDALVILLCFQEQVESRPVWHDIFFGLFSVLSSLFLALTLLVYLILPEMRDIQDKAMMSVTASFMVAFFLNGNQRLNFPPLDEDVTCLFVAFVMYYAYLCAFFWLNIISLNIFRSVWFPSLKLRSDVLFAVYCMIGWGLPLCFLAATLTTHHIEGYHLKPGFGEVNCWFNGSHAKWTFFYGPILVLLSANLIYLALTSYKLWHEYRELDCCKLKVLRFKCTMYAKLAVMMGFTWIFEVISFASGETNQFYWILPDVLNVLQGIFIFILLVVSRKRVRKLLAKRKPFNISFPKSWAAYADLENCPEPAGVEELELSQTS
ncbi:probable G-protein coupled receptor Mth-like 1 isoform X1 [Nasonia vitripennis]|uniref:G-protein coupled receptors family 2 profile 2 domain-containing protein n=1 Tax=Nasonia vitripennis TaxID=7425 RepID=A0A7M7GF79_NASVI|nr:probable G-protein coupled receptor Mth-like 1 isoform X1 [Nasonia vitripennis]